MIGGVPSIPRPTSLDRPPVTDVETPSSAMSDGNSDSDGEDDATRFAEALSLKEAGNAALKASQFDEAREHYVQGLKKLKKRSVSTEEEHLALARALNLNLALACLKTENYFDGMQAAGEVLKKDPNNIKALLRRGKCASLCGDLDRAKADYAAVLREEPSNREARAELTEVKQKLAAAYKSERSAYKGIFDKGQSLYADREAQMEKARQAAELKLQALKSDWKKEMDTKSEPERVSFEDWKAEKDKLSTGEPLPTSSRDPAVSSSPANSAVAAPLTAKSPSSTSKPTAAATDELELDEEDLKILEETKKKGYCYFRRELTEEEKRRRETEHIPTRVDSPSVPAGTSGPGFVGPASPGGIARAAGKGVSEWNVGGTTYEEKDATEWCKNKLVTLLSGVKWESAGWQHGNLMDSLLADPSNLGQMMEALKNPEKEMAQLTSNLYPFAIRITGNPDVSGDAQVMVVRGGKRWWYEFNVKVEWELEIRGGGDNESAAGVPQELAMTLQRTGLQKATKWRGTLRIEELSSVYSSDEQSTPLRKKLVASATNVNEMGDIERQIYTVAVEKLRESFIQAITNFEKAYHESY